MQVLFYLSIFLLPFNSIITFLFKTMTKTWRLKTVQLLGWELTDMPWCNCSFRFIWYCKPLDSWLLWFSSYGMDLNITPCLHTISQLILQNGQWLFQFQWKAHNGFWRICFQEFSTLINSLGKFFITLQHSTEWCLSCEDKCAPKIDVILCMASLIS